jgi:Family of unknown function (DUF6481)
MAGYKLNNFDERASTAAKAKQALIERFRARPGPDDPAVIALAEERRKIADAREIRAAERRVAKEADEARKRAELAAQAVEQAKRDAEARQRLLEEAARQRLLAVEQKAARDARYAARKARR